MRWIPPSVLLAILVPPASAAISPSSGPTTQPARPIVGAIRWDAWHGERGVPGRAVQKSLGPAKYHFRLPFFAKVVEPDRVEIRGDRQDIMDREITYARQAGIDYWAFVTYPPQDAMSIGLDLFLKSQVPDKPRFCLIIECQRFGKPGGYRPIIERYAQLTREANYQTELAGRPLLFILLHGIDGMARTWGSLANYRKAIDELRGLVVSGGGKQPYIVAMTFDPKGAQRLARELGLDGISSYAQPGGTLEGSPFIESRTACRRRWEQSKAIGAQVVPLVSLGWDPRPRVDNPVPWWPDCKGNHYRTAAPEELAQHLGEALEWTTRNREAAAAQVLILYAWNENDEGGWLVPTLKADGSAATARIDAIRQVLRPGGERATTRASRFSFLFAAEGVGEILRYAADGTIEWEYPAPMSRDVWQLPSGNALFCYNERYDARKDDNPSGVMEVTPDRRIVFHFQTTGQVWSCQRLADGTTLVGAASQGKLLIVSPEGKIVREIKLVNRPGHSCLRNARQIAGGHFLVAEESARAVREYDAEGKLLREIKVPFMPYSALRLPDGHTLICGQQSMVEVDAQDKVVWTLEGKELPQLGIRWFAGLQVLPQRQPVRLQRRREGRPLRDHAGEEGRLAERRCGPDRPWHSSPRCRRCRADSKVRLLRVKHANTPPPDQAA